MPDLLHKTKPWHPSGLDNDNIIMELEANISIVEDTPSSEEIG